jgi:hypothetical protein
MSDRSDHGQSPRWQGRLIYHFSPQAFGTVRRLLEEQCGAVLETSFVDPLGDSATFEFRVDGALLTLDYDHWQSFSLLSAGPTGRAVLQSLRALLDAGEYPVLEESEF